MNVWLEKMLLNLDEGAPKGDPDACIELVNLYSGENRPLSALAFGHKAKRLGSDIEISPLESAVENLRDSDWSNDPAGCYRLGVELSSYHAGQSDLRRAISYLKAATGSEIAEIAGSAALCLADLLRYLGQNTSEAYRYYEIAERNGMPDILASNDEHSRESSVA